MSAPEHDQPQYTKVAIGFYTTREGKVWSVQNLRKPARNLLNWYQSQIVRRLIPCTHNGRVSNRRTGFKTS
jgi:hypothetical protein